VARSDDNYWVGQDVTKVSQDNVTYFQSVVARNITQKNVTEKAPAKVQWAL
tara:strand:- start:10286 stop:10438 length:153 start_codon:yes stop_codon:yes gene_type:complete